MTLYATGWRTPTAADDPYGDDAYEQWHPSFSARVNGADSPPEGRGLRRSTPARMTSVAPAASSPCAPEPPTSAAPGGARSSATLPPPTGASLTERTARVGQHPASPRPNPATAATPPAAVAGPSWIDTALAVVYLAGCVLILVGSLRLSVLMEVF